MIIIYNNFPCVLLYELKGNLTESEYNEYYQKDHFYPNSVLNLDFLGKVFIYKNKKCIYWQDIRTGKKFKNLELLKTIESYYQSLVDKKHLIRNDY